MVWAGAMPVASRTAAITSRALIIGASVSSLDNVTMPFMGASGRGSATEFTREWMVFSHSRQAQLTRHAGRDYIVLPEAEIMSAVIKTKLVKIGNSQGIRIPRVIVKQAGLQGELELEVRRKQLVVRPAYQPRQGWEARFREMSERGDDRLLWPDTTLTSFDEKEWEW